MRISGFSSGSSRIMSTETLSLTADLSSGITGGFIGSFGVFSYITFGFSGEENAGGTKDLCKLMLLLYIFSATVGFSIVCWRYSSVLRRSNGLNTGCFNLISGLVSPFDIAVFTA